jgi:hypothetical protein
MTDFVEWNPKHHGHKPLHWTPDMLTSVDGKNFVRQTNWAWIAGSTYYVPHEAVGMVREVVEPEPVAADADRIEALVAENGWLREALRVYAGPLEWTQEGGWGMFPVWADGYPGGVYIDDNTLDFGDAARAALEKQP